MQPRQLNREIAQLEQQLQQQRRQLGAQTRAVTKAVHNRLSSPAALVVATLSGALLGWWLYRHQNSVAAGQSSTSKSLARAVIWLRSYLWAGVMAYLVRLTV